MGRYLNPGNAGFTTIKNGEYVDKTGLISLINKTIDTPQKLTCISRPRRFGKSFAAQMLCAYYDCTCDSGSLFDDLTISSDTDYRTCLNQYNVIYLDITGFLSNLKRRQKDLREVVYDITQALRNELLGAMSTPNDTAELVDCLRAYATQTDRKFVFIIDEWDAVIREAKNDPATQEAFLNLLREWFKNGNFTPQVVAAAYMTGILPIKKDGTESAISDFLEYTILNPGEFTQYTGFTEDEVRELCRKNNSDFDRMKEWYDGYSFTRERSVYNPYSVMTALRMSSYESYWQKTSAAEALTTYIDMNFDGLQDAILRLISGESLEVNVDSFENDIESFRCKDDVITLLIHLGYLTYNNTEKRVRIPNKEVQNEFKNLLRNADKTKLCQLVQASERLLTDTLDGREERVANSIEAIRESSYAPAYYNDEQALRYVIRFAYIVCVDQYLRIEELPSGKGVADVVYLPRKQSPLPAMVIELKWNKTADAAIRQILDRNYPQILRDYTGNIILVAINYDEKTKKHSCKIIKERI